jgi:hypothetical protein
LWNLRKKIDTQRGFAILSRMRLNRRRNVMVLRSKSLGSEAVATDPSLNTFCGIDTAWFSPRQPNGA